MEWTPIVDCAAHCNITVGASHTSAVATTIQFTDWEGNNLTVPTAVKAYLASDADGLDIHTTSLDSDISIGTDGDVIIITASTAYLLVSEADGAIDISMGYTSGAETFYLVIVLPNGKRVVSTVITFT